MLWFTFHFQISVTLMVLYDSQEATSYRTYCIWFRWRCKCSVTFLGYIMVKKGLTQINYSQLQWCLSGVWSNEEIRKSGRPMCLRPFRLLLTRSCFYSGLHGINHKTLIDLNWSEQAWQLDANQYCINAFSNSSPRPWHLYHCVSGLSKWNCMLINCTNNSVCKAR